MLTNYVYAFRLNKYNIKIKSHIVLKHLMYSTYNSENDLVILTSIYIYIYIYIYILHPLHTTNLLFDFYSTKVSKENKDI
jgi:hypothetical protein